MVVVLHHLYLVASPFLKKLGTGPGSLYWWISETPLKLLSAGTEAVLVFFVLSGLVVALPTLGRKFSWASFLTGRMLRLYLPVWASLLVGTALIWVLPRDASSVTSGAWVGTSNATSTTLGSLLNQASLTLASYNIDNVLWSLRWELLFSVLLPLFVAVAVVVTKRWWAIAIGVAFATTIVGDFVHLDALRYLPAFFIGTVMAVRLDAIREWTKRRQTRPGARLWSAGLITVSLLLLIAAWLALPIAHSGSTTGTVLGQLSLLGAAGLVLAAIGAPPMRRALDSRAVQWLGRISFSLYLVHVPIIATLSFWLGDANWLLVALLAVPIALLVAWGFHHAVERPSHRLARATSKFVAARIERVTARPSATGSG
jgi:peptidoglycan/LPS O-acetylase OafA/YrhL